MVRGTVAVIERSDLSFIFDPQETLPRQPVCPVEPVQSLQLGSRAIR